VGGVEVLLLLAGMMEDWECESERSRRLVVMDEAGSAGS
jgi:hypothetical protein